MAEIGLFLCLIYAVVCLLLWAIGALIGGLANVIEWLVRCGQNARPPEVRERRPSYPRRAGSALGTRPYDIVFINSVRQYLRNADERHQELLASASHDGKAGLQALDAFHRARAREMAMLGFMIGRIEESRAEHEDDSEEVDRYD